MTGFNIVASSKTVRPAKFAVLCATAIVTIAGCSGGSNTGLTNNQAGTFFGPAQSLGNGSARSFVTLDNAGNPTSIGLTFNAAALTGLPAEQGPEVVLPLPQQASATAFNHITIEWAPGGHPPPGVYNVPHFDFHFYILTPEERNQIVPGRGTQRPAIQFIPEGYAPDPSNSVVPRMGIHWSDLRAPEFNGQPFTRTFVYGYYNGQMAFMEPMVTKSFLDRRPNVTSQLRLPTAYPKPGYYPINYSIRFDAESNTYSVILGGLTRR